MAVTSQPELYVRAKLAEVARVQRRVDRLGWEPALAPFDPPVRTRFRCRLGLAIIRVGAAIAGPGALPLRAATVHRPV